MITYTRIITDDEQKMLENDLLDIKQWIDLAIAGKINNCLKRAARQYDEFAKNKNIPSVPSKDDLKVKEFFAHPDYKNRTARDASIV